MTALNIVILAAGRGSRMCSDQPKVLHQLAGKALINHVLLAARSLAPSRLVVIYGYQGESLRQAISDEDILWVHQSEQKGTGHAVMLALATLDLQSPQTLILYGDVPLISSQTLATLCQAQVADKIALLTARLRDPKGYGRIVRDENDAVLRIVEEKDASVEEQSIGEVNTGILVAPTARLAQWLAQLRNDNAQNEYYLTDIIAMAAQSSEVVTREVVSNEEVFGVNSRNQLADLERWYQLQKAHQLMAAGVTLCDPARIDIRGTLSVEQDITIDINCIFEGNVTLEKGVQIGAHCIIKDTHIAANTIIHPFSHIDGAKIEASASIGPYARLRPQTLVSENAHVGNFVELKNTTLGNGSKANHLSYLGDASIGSNVNVGAGTITCNYDGINKHRTVIEAGAFIGSGSELVAPITVGAGATIGAGTTLRADAPADQLTLMQSRQTTLSRWRRPKKIIKN